MICRLAMRWAYAEGVDMEWVDATSYSRGDKERVPKTWQAKHLGVRLTVTRRIHEEGWFVMCHAASIDCVGLGDIPLEEAKEAAVLKLFEKAEALVAAATAFEGLV